MLCSGPGGTVRMDALMYEIIIIFKSALGLFLFFKKLSHHKNVIGRHAFLHFSIE